MSVMLVAVVFQPQKPTEEQRKRLQTELTLLKIESSKCRPHLRWGRNLSDLISTIEALSLLGVSLVSATESVDMTSPAGKAMVSMLSVFSNFAYSRFQEKTWTTENRSKTHITKKSAK